MSCKTCKGTKTVEYTKDETKVTEFCRDCVTLHSCKKGHELIQFYYDQCPFCMLIEALNDTQEILTNNIGILTVRRGRNERILAYIRR